MALPRVEFGLLGPVTFVVDGRRVPLTGKQRTLLALLLLHANQPVSVEQLTDGLWDSRPPASAPARVRALVAELRRAVGERGRDVVVTRSPGYQVRVGPDALDTEVFRTLVRDARAAHRDGRPEAAVAHYTTALGLWQGTPLADVPGTWLEAERRRLAESRLTAREERAEARLRLGDFGQVVAELQPLIAEHPLRERPRSHLMTALWRDGRPAEALEAYRDFRAYLVAELGVEPTEELRALHQRVLTGDAGGPPAPAVPQDRGPAPAPVPGAAPVPRLLPASLGSFVGRTAEVGALDRLSAGPSRLLLVTGPAGAGKSTLAVEWARRRAAHFPDGQLFLEMRGFDRAEKPMTPSEALPSLLRALGTPTAEIPHQLQEQVQLYRSLTADRRLLVLLDDVGGPGQVRPLLPSGPGCLTVVTSRVRLAGLAALNGADRLDLDVLTQEEALELLRRAAGASRVDADPQGAHRLVEQCGRLPLALAIAAARLADQPHRTLSAYTTELRERGRLARLRIEGDESAAVQAALDLSYRSLGDEARRLFRLLGLVPKSGVTVKAAAALAASPAGEIEDLLESVARVHLVSPRAGRRYVCHDLLREYAVDRVRHETDAGERTAALSRLYDYYLRSVVEVTRAAGLQQPALPHDPPAADHAPEHFTGPADAYRWVDAAWDDLTALITQAAEGTFRRMSWLLLEALVDVLHHRRPLAEWVRLGELVLAGARAEGDLAGQAAAHLSLARARWRMAELEDAREDFRRAGEFARAADWRPGEAAALRGGGVVVKQLGDPRAALPMYRAALVLYRAVDDERGASVSLNNLASAHLTLAELGPAEEYLEQVLAPARRTHNHNLEAITLVNLGLVRQQQGRLEGAREVLREALALAERQGFDYAVAVAHETLGRVHNDAGRREEAVAAFTAALELAERVENRNCQVDALAGLAAALSDRDETATRYVERALRIARSTGHHTGLIDVLVSASEVHRRAGRTGEAEESARHALRLARDDGPLGVARARCALAAVLLQRDETGAAAEECRLAVQDAERAGQTLARARALELLRSAEQGVQDPNGVHTPR